MVTGTVIARKHGGIRETFTVRRIVAGEGVERIFPIHSPYVEKVEVKRPGKVRRTPLEMAVETELEKPGDDEITVRVPMQGGSESYPLAIQRIRRAQVAR